ncbi:MAG TPA: hypothetical protein VF081_12330 [Solirubrobacterales bacterium]
MRERRGLLGLMLVLAVVGALAAVPAQAEWGPIELVSKNAADQADFAEQPAISADGRYVAFRGSIGGLLGIFRKDLASGAVELVVGGDAYAAPAPAATAASEPSISADGRFVSFTTNAQLDPQNDQAASSSDVYVADLGGPAPSYELASARDGTSAGLAYSGGPGALATGRISLSADGRRVAFITIANSNLTGNPANLETPPLQVAVRDLAADSTALVSVARNSLTGTMEPGMPVSEGALVSTTLPGASKVEPGAALSADGSTVAWLGMHLPAQVPLLADEGQNIATGEGFGLVYDEPLWRRVPSAADPAPPTRRVVGGGQFPALADGHPNLDKNQCGPLNGWIAGRARLDYVPKLSADGGAVAMIGEPNGYANVFFADMTAGAAGAGAVRQLTREVPIREDDACRASEPSLLAGAGDITATAVSADGRRVAFATQRQQFPLAPPNLVGGPPAGMGVAELYRVDLGGQTLERVTHGLAAPSEPSKVVAGLIPDLSLGGASALSFSGNGETLSFASLANNLVAADGNRGPQIAEAGSDAFLVTDQTPPTERGLVGISTPPPALRTKGRWVLTVSAVSDRDGSVRVAVGVPGRGRLRGQALAAIGDAGKRRQVAAAARRAKRAAVLILKLRPAAKLHRLVHSDAGLEATVRLSFRGPGGRPLRESIDVRFRAQGRGAR